MEIYLIRHAESFVANTENYDYIKKTANPKLTEKGFKQAKILSKRCADIKFDKIYSSDLYRATQTADVLNNIINTERIINSNFREIDMGDIYLNSWNKYPDIFRKWSKHEKDIAYPNGENGDALFKRCRKSIDIIINNNYERIAIVTHGGTIRSIICGILDIPQQRRFYLGLPPENCSISIIKYLKDEHKFFLHTFNDYSHMSQNK